MSRKEAIARGERYYFTGVPCKNNHIAKRSVTNSTCYECQQEQSKQFRTINSEYHTKYNKKYAKENEAKLRIRYKQDAAIRRTQKAEAVNRVHAAYRERNRSKIRQRTKQNMVTYPWLYADYTAARRSRKLQATPVWASLTDIREIYAECHTINTICKMYGASDQFVVDHVIPLQGATVCGFHVADNLDVVLASYNSFKSNTYEI